MKENSKLRDRPKCIWNLVYDESNTKKSFRNICLLKKGEKRTVYSRWIKDINMKDKIAFIDQNLAEYL